MVGIVAVERRHVKRRREAGLALREQIFEAFIGILGSTKTGEHTHGPGLGAIHRGLYAACIGILARQVKVATIIQRGVILRRIDALDRHARCGHQILALRHALRGRLNRLCFPILVRFREARKLILIKKRALFDNRRLGCCLFLWQFLL